MTNYAQQLRMGLWFVVALVVGGLALGIGLFFAVQWIAETLA